MDSWYDYRALLACDIAGSAGRGETRLQAIRSALRSALCASFGVADLDEQSFVRIDTGDGFHFVAPAGLPKARLLYPLLPELCARIRAHNRQATPDVHLRVRVAVHAGEIRFDSAGTFSGSPFEALARLLDSDPLRQAVRAGTSGTPVAAVLSQHFYEETVGHGYEGLEADAFTAADVRVKEYSAQAWLWYPGSPVGPRIDPGPSAVSDRRPPDPEPRGAGQHVRASGHGTAYAVQHGTQNIHHHERG
ncbi:hypothetical protein ACIGXM_23560 [Kitasatospora sp. NPDC052896]|uniref:hypothetical protein n=1 Tax=Kitasatospora sp. NPDC052896 TaxID=3364061 RepID=UPI0037C86B6A